LHTKWGAIWRNAICCFCKAANQPFGTNTKLLASYEHFWHSSVKDFEDELSVFALYAPLSLEWDIHTQLKLKKDNEADVSVGFSMYF
jgi:hypothetical protein